MHPSKERTNGLWHLLHSWQEQLPNLQNKIWGLLLEVQVTASFFGGLQTTSCFHLRFLDQMDTWSLKEKTGKE